MDKLTFLQKQFPELLQTLLPDAKGSWGVMNGQQMVEHMAESVSFATGNNNQALHTAPDLVDRYKEFAMSDKEFKPNTKNALMSDIPVPTTKSNMNEAITEYKNQMADFVAYFENNKGGTLTNSFFGELNFEQWTHLLHKHAMHHSKQFGLL